MPASSSSLPAARLLLAGALLSTLLSPLLPARAAPLVWEGSVGIADGPGEKGPWQQNESRYRYVDDPTISIGPDGGIAVAWVDQASKDVFFRRLGPDGRPLSAALNVSRSGDTFSWLPRMERAPDAQGTVYLLWQEIIFSGGSHGGDMLFARSGDDGRSFSPPLNLSASVGGDGKGRINAKTWHNGSQDLAAGPGGEVYAAWTEYDGALWFTRSADGGKTFSRPRVVAGEDPARPARAPSLAVGRDRTVYLAWTHGEDAGADIHLAVSRDGGEAFGKPVAVAPADGYADAPKLGIGPDGALHLAYAQSDGGPFGRFRINYTRSDDGGRSFAPARDVSSPLPGRADSARFPYLAIDAAGRLAIAYELFPDHRRDPRGLGVTVSGDGGRSFSPPSAIPDSTGPAGGTNGSHQGWLMEKLAMDDKGRLVIVNSTLVQDRLSRVWLMRGKSAAPAGPR
ncbi:sialidase family protein [Noviherbaspirillum aridicola]|uniref:Exo-alpha-sialidase n=1 Tax=Noviherbaspirillum aridicola TaxID=2849687 RepID=A0ABQ4QA68_9BURK|nr:sialidase family protein [Noviherbaspirillum aridicola]GIZ53951.1 hypothetical protein NCCP691_39650 [Noviherbaspirillum aridicola]